MGEGTFDSRVEIPFPRPAKVELVFSPGQTKVREKYIRIQKRKSNENVLQMLKKKVDSFTFLQRLTKPGFQVLLLSESAVFVLYMPLSFLFRFVSVLNINKYFFIKVPFDTIKYYLSYTLVAFQNLNFATLLHSFVNRRLFLKINSLVYSVLAYQKLGDCSNSRSDIANNFNSLI